MFQVKNPLTRKNNSGGSRGKEGVPKRADQVILGPSWTRGLRVLLE